MITKPTLFILGAGASIPYGFPSGWELRHQICAAASGQFNVRFKNLTESLGVSTGELVRFATWFKESGVASIDSFLSRHDDLAEIGKSIIASALVPYEDTTKFNNYGNPDDWYVALWNALITNVSTIDELSGNKVQIYTFNYDRSLEKYLHTSIIHTFNVSNETALEALKNFNIHHVYGSLGIYAHTDDYDMKTRRYLPEADSVILRLAAQSIKVIPEARSDDAIFKKIKEAYTWAVNVCFLGFGFDDLNMQRLGFQGIAKSENGVHVKLNKAVVTSACGITNSELEVAHAALFNSYNYYRNPVWDFQLGLRNLETLRNFAWLLK